MAPGNKTWWSWCCSERTKNKSFLNWSNRNLYNNTWTVSEHYQSPCWISCLFLPSNDTQAVFLASGDKVICFTTPHNKMSVLKNNKSESLQSCQQLCDSMTVPRLWGRWTSEFHSIYRVAPEMFYVDQSRRLTSPSAAWLESNFKEAVSSRQDFSNRTGLLTPHSPHTHTPTLTPQSDELKYKVSTMHCFLQSSLIGKDFSTHHVCLCILHVWYQLELHILRTCSSFHNVGHIDKQI